MTQLTYIEKRALYESIMNVIAKKVKQMLNENCNEDSLNETLDAAAEKRNEEYVEQLCNKYKLIYCEGDSVGGEKRQLETLKEVRALISKRMPVGRIDWIVPDNKYFFTFKSRKSGTL